MQKAFRNYSLLTFFLLTYIFSTAQREAIKPVDVKGETTTTSTKAFNAKGTPAKIKDTYGIWTDFNLRTKDDADKLLTQIGYTLFEEIANNCNETSGWPGAIASYTERNKVRDQMLKYICYQIAEVDDKWILRVPVSENSFLPYGVRPEHDIFFMVRKTDVELTGSPSNTASSGSSYTSSTTSSSYTPVSNLKGPRAKVKDSFGIWTDFVLTTKDDAAQVKTKLGYALYNDVADNCNETKWPSGISSYAMREKVRAELKQYVCYQIGESDDKWILRVPAAENSFQPYNMRPTRDIYFVVRKTDVELSGSPINTLTGYTSTTSTASTPSSSYYTKAYLAKINATGGMYSTFSLETETKAAYLKGYWGDTDFEDVTKYCREENWPTGISTLSERDKVRSQMNNYKAYRIAEFDGKAILKIPADENKFMPYNMRPSRDIFFVINTTDITVAGGSSTTRSTSTTSTTTAKPPVGFAAQLNALLAEYPDDFDNLKGAQRAKDVFDWWDCTVQLAGAKETYVQEGFLTGGNDVVAEFGKFKNKADADAKFKDVYNKMNASKITCCELKAEKVSKTDYDSYTWTPVAGSSTTEYGYEEILITLENNKRFDEWDVSLRISTQ